ncbi:MAG: hypothetical protein ACRERE_04860 [Candidatus Entotheonellia bacterium]
MSSSPHPDRAGWRPPTPEEERAAAEIQPRLVEQSRKEAARQAAADDARVKHQKEVEAQQRRRALLGGIALGVMVLMSVALTIWRPSSPRQDPQQQAREPRDDARLWELRAANTSRLVAYPPTGSGAPLVVASGLGPSSCESRREQQLRDALAKSQPLPDVRCEPELAWWMRAELALRELLHQERGR